VLHDQLGSTKEDRPKSAGEGSQLAHGRFGTSLPRIATHHALISGLLIGHSGPEPVVFCYAFGLKLLPNRHKAVGALGRAVSILSVTLGLTTFALAGRALRRLGQQRDVREPVRFRWKSGRVADIVRRPDLTQCMVRPCVARRFLRVGGCAVLHQCIRPLIGAFCAPGHHGYQRACELVSGQASMGPFGSPVFACAGKTDPPSRFHPLADLGR